MLLLSDNDILIKLGLLGLLPDFIKALKLDVKEVYITHSTLYSLPSQLKKYTKNVEVYQPVLDLVNTFQKIESVDELLMSELLSIHNIDSGEAVLAAKLISIDNGYLATGDKRFLMALKETQYAHHFNHRVFTFEKSLEILCQALTYSVVKDRIISSIENLDKPLDSLFRISFKENSTESVDLDCLQSYSRDLENFLVPLIN